MPDQPGATIVERGGPAFSTSLQPCQGGSGFHIRLPFSRVRFCWHGPRRGSRCHGSNGGALRCTTERQNTHVIDRREVLYRWHPWFGRSVYVHEMIDKPGDAVFRCNCTGGRSDRFLEVPVWMFDRAARAPCRGADTAHVDLAALTALAGLVCDVGCIPVGNFGSPSRVGATSDSEYEIRRLAYAAQDDDEATGTFPGQPVHVRNTDSALAEPVTASLIGARGSRP